MNSNELQRYPGITLGEYKRILMIETIEAYLPLEGSQQEEFERLMDSPEHESTRMGLQTTFEKGQMTAQLRMLRRLLQKRFGPIHQAVLDRLEGLTCEQRDDLAENLVTAKSLEELGLAVRVS